MQFNNKGEQRSEMCKTQKEFPTNNLYPSEKLMVPVTLCILCW